MAGQSFPRKSSNVSRDDSIMATNNSSIVSKRSVERSYYPEPHFYRYFVKKPQRRSPLINRGYWLRMHAVEHVIKRFLEMPCHKHKVVLNLGCGYDPLAFQWLSKQTSSLQNTKFVDVDFPELIARKCDVIRNTPQLQELLNDWQRPSEASGVFLRSDHYSALGCDLTDLARLEKMLAGEVDAASSLILCTAEVSITYMNVGAADALMQWAAHYDDIHFCLLEQYLPAGAEHPFAKKMIQHFDKLQTPLRCVHKYPRLSDQRGRFQHAGWSSTLAMSLWDLWNERSIVSPQDKLKLDAVEPFDEWEEFVLFASHYLILVATKSSCESSSLLHCLKMQDVGEQDGRPDQILHVAETPSAIRFDAIPHTNLRRFGALLSVSDDVLGHYGGLGCQSRLGDLDLYGLKDCQIPKGTSVAGIEPRMCHSISATGQNTYLLAGGRSSPSRALEDCWILCERSYRVDDLPIGLYRHCAAEVNLEHAGPTCPGVLVYGGKTAKNVISDQWFLWRKTTGWTQLDIADYTLKPRFGAAMASIDSRRGLLFGGMDAEGRILSETWEWSISDGERGPCITLSHTNARTEMSTISYKDKSDIAQVDELSVPLKRDLAGRFGACLVNSPFGCLLIGGVSTQATVQGLDILRLTKINNREDIVSAWHCIPLLSQRNDQRPLLVGHTAFAFRENVVIVGGGAMCFSFGTHWNRAMHIISSSAKKQVQLVPLAGDLTQHSSQRMSDASTVRAVASTIQSIHKIKIKSAQEFEHVVRQGHPMILCGLQLGSCTTDWTPQNLKAKLSCQRTVVVHESTDTQMDFRRKNFRYVKKPFARFIDEVNEGSRQYLRSVASSSPSETPANFWSDFPELCPDFELPTELELVRKNMHSSVFRISGPVAMWLHYDVMANVLCQIRGSKRLLLYPPSDVSFFDIPPGTSSSSVNCFDPGLSDNTSLGLAHPQEALLMPGDVLFIPPLWLHTSTPHESISISVNAFFCNLKNAYAPGRDVYGNRDIQAYEKGRKDIERMVQSFARLPSEMARFYLDRLADELKVEAQKHGS